MQPIKANVITQNCKRLDVTPTPDITLVFPSSNLGVRNALSRILSNLETTGLTSEELGTIELVLAEVMNNVVEHAYKNNPNGMIDLKVSRQENGLKFKIIDTGTPMPEGQIPLGSRALLDCEIDALPEGGFGWFLIRDLARDLTYQRKENKNFLEFRISVGIE